MLELARLAVGLAEAEHQLRSGSPRRGTRTVAGPRARGRSADGLLVRQRRQRPPRRADREVDGLGRRPGSAASTKWYASSPRGGSWRRRAAARGSRRSGGADPLAGAHSATHRASPESARGRTCSAPQHRRPPRRSGAPWPPRAPRAPLAGQLGKSVEQLDRERSADRGRHRHDAARRRRQRDQAPLDRLPHAFRYSQLGERRQASPLGPHRRRRRRSGGAAPPR